LAPIVAREPHRRSAAISDLSALFVRLLGLPAQV
jgi:hypothetical protein